MYRERKYLMEAITKNKQKLNDTIMQTSEPKASKTSESSKIARANGNELFVKGKHDNKTHREIFLFYNQSICMAPVDSEDLALAYGNRSAFLRHIAKYEDCIVDINRALNITNSDILMIKLLCRKVECLKAQDSTDGEFKQGPAALALEAAKCIFKKLDSNEKSREDLCKLIVTAGKSLVRSPKQNKNDDENEWSSNAEIAKVIHDKELPKAQNQVSIRYNKKYGRHLVANKDFKPGDVIFVEKFYAQIAFKEQNYIVCQYCFKTCWSGISCDYCTWAMFCDEKCKKEAWDTYHNIDCSTWDHPTLLGDDEFTNNFFISFRVLMTAIKEFDGDISKLKAEIDSVENESDTANKGFVKNGKFNSSTIRSIYSMLTPTNHDGYIKQISDKAVYVLIRLIECTKVFGNFKIKNVEELLAYEDAIFLGSLFIKLCLSQQSFASPFQSLPLMCMELNLDHNKIGRNTCCQRGLIAASFKSLTNHNCFPNIAKCASSDGITIVHAILPIKKNTQIFCSYTFEFFEDRKEVRQNLLWELYQFVCDCTACTEDWPVMDGLISEGKQSLHYELCKYCKPITDKIENGVWSYDLNAVKKLSKALSKAMKHFEQPDDVTVMIYQHITIVLQCIYGLRPLTFGKCDKF